jgi:hypothetical protein
MLMWFVNFVAVGSHDGPHDGNGECNCDGKLDGLDG